MAGLHLNGPMFEPLVPRVLDDLATLAPSVIVPTLCTGWRAQHNHWRPLRERDLPNSVGTRFEI